MKLLFYVCIFLISICFILPLTCFMVDWCRSSHSQMIFKIGVLKNFANFTGKHLSWSLFSIKLTPTQLFSSEYCEIFKNSFFTQHLWRLFLLMIIIRLNWNAQFGSFKWESFMDWHISRQWFWYPLKNMIFQGV